MICVNKKTDQDQAAIIAQVIKIILSAGYFCAAYQINQLMNSSKDKPFFPSGAISFFVALVVLALLFWYGIYFLMIERV